MRIVTNLLHSYDAAGNNLIVIIGADARENSWIGEALAEHAAISMASRARGLTLVNTDLMSVGTREKLYAQGGIFDSPTIAGIGEAGPEAVVPLDKLWDKLDKIAEVAHGDGVVINVYACVYGNVKD